MSKRIERSDYALSLCRTMQHDCDIFERYCDVIVSVNKDKLNQVFHPKEFYADILKTLIADLEGNE